MHLLASTIAKLDEAEAAIDLEQSPAEIVVLSFADSDLSALAAAWKSDAGILPTLRLASLKKLKHPMSVDLYAERVVAHARAVIVRCLGGFEYWRYGLEIIASIAHQKNILFAALPGDDRPDSRLAEISTVTAETLSRLDSFFREGGPENLCEALRYVGSLLDRDISWTDAMPIGPVAGFSTDGRALPLQDLIGALDQRPVALVLFYKASLLAADTAPIRALMAGLEKQDLTPVAVAVTSLKDSAAAQSIGQLIAARRPAIILNATAFSALRDDGTTVLDAADVPVLQVVLASSAQEAWASSSRGLSPADLAMNVVLPELDGRLLSRAVSFKAEDDFDSRIEFAAVRHKPCPDRIDFVVRQAGGFVKLSRTPRAERKLALVLSDYPARAGRAGYAVGLDTTESVVQIVNLLRGEGYDVGAGGLRAADVELLLSRHSARLDIPLASYARWLKALPPSLQNEIENRWGGPAADPSVENNMFSFPVLEAGKLRVFLQPDRGSLRDRKTGYHDTSIPPRHAYVALYAWLREQAQIDALIHLGTHGTLEWLPGKALALSAECWPEAVTGPLPVIYPFIVNNPGEAVQAKRRLSAVTIGHLTPPLSAAGLHGAMAELEALVEEYADAEGLDRRRLDLLEGAIIDNAWTSGLAAECKLSKDEPARDAIVKLDAHLCDIKELSIRDRLHVFGRAPTSDVQSALLESIIAAGGASVTVERREQIEAAVRNCALHEERALVAALDGRRVSPGPAGAPSRGRADVLPTGRNLTTIDPRSIPTRTATTIGLRAADEVVRRYLQDHGDYPRVLVIDLWASTSLRTGGDDLAQALGYLGARPVWDMSSNRVTGVEVLPLAKLERPRIDVTLRISGLFRDIFETQIALLDTAIRKVASLDEDDADNPLACSHRRGDNLARIFGGAPGSYGAGTATLALDGNWRAREDLGEAYLSAVTHAYGAVQPVMPAGDGFRDRVSAADALVHPQDDRERDLLDGDGVADFVGGFAAAAALLGNDAKLYHLDTSEPSTPKARTVGEEIARIVRGRLTNPRWIAGMLAHGYRGVAEIAQGVDALFAFAATTRAVPNHLFDIAHDALIGDEAVLAGMIGANPAGAAAIASRLRDALTRGLWVARRNAVAGELDRAIAKSQHDLGPSMEAAK
jgi:cobaltochelatase CobN